jgi:hypothetical protein
MTERSLATSADYADALLVSRRAKHWLFLFILLMLLLQMAFFFTARYTDLVAVAPAGASTLAASAATPTTQPGPAARSLLNYVSGFTLFLGTILPILLAMVLLLIVHIMLVGRLIGVTRVTSAFLWCLVLMLLMFPWQIFFGGSNSPSDFRLPGVLYTWHDLRANAKFDGHNTNLAVVKWARFFVMPLVATVLLLMIQIKSNRGLRQALGEETPDVTITT